MNYLQNSQWKFSDIFWREQELFTFATDSVAKIPFGLKMFQILPLLQHTENGNPTSQNAYFNVEYNGISEIPLPYSQSQTIEERSFRARQLI